MSFKPENPHQVPDMFGYEVIALMDDGESLCWQCVADETNPVHYDGDADGWRIEAWYTSGDCETSESCAHCNRIIVADEDSEEGAP